jgi:hypothetical protein
MIHTDIADCDSQSIMFQEGMPNFILSMCNFLAEKIGHHKLKRRSLSTHPDPVYAASKRGVWCITPREIYTLQPLAKEIILSLYYALSRARIPSNL